MRSERKAEAIRVVVRVIRVGGVEYQGQGRTEAEAFAALCPMIETPEDDDNPFAGDYTAIRAELAANPPAVGPTRSQARWGRRQGSAGYARQRRG